MQHAQADNHRMNTLAAPGSAFGHKKNRRRFPRRIQITSFNFANTPIVGVRQYDFI
jgi:hypothetical protein